MASRFMLHSSGAIATPSNPGFDAQWEQTGQAVRLPMDIKPQAGAPTTIGVSGTITVPITTTQDILCYQFVSRQIFLPVRLDAGVLLSMVIACAEAAVSANAFLAYSLKAISPDGSRVLATLSQNTAGGGTEFGNSMSTRIFSAVAITASTMSEPWRLVLELGVRATGPTAAQSFTMRAGTNNAADFALTSGLTTDLNPWMELSTNLNATGLNNYQGIKVGDGMGCSERIR